MKNQDKRLAALEQRTAGRQQAAVVDVPELAAGLVDAWQAIDAGAFASTAYHRRALTSLRCALEGIIGEGPRQTTG